MSISSPKMFAPSTTAIDTSQLCFNKAHFTRSDFDVQRFMTLARRRSDLKTIHADLRLYLKSIQHSMVELINEDYAHFVHLSSNLVGLKTPIDSIHNSIDTVWKDFNNTAKDAVAQAEKIEQRCGELAAARTGQQKIRKQIAVVSSVKRLRVALREMPSPLTATWLDRVSSLVAEAVVNAEGIEEDAAIQRSYKSVMRTLEGKLQDECITSLLSSLSLLPLLFSLLSLTRSTDSLVARVVSSVIDPSIKVDPHSPPLDLLQSELKQISQLRQKWSTQLGPHSKGPVMKFLDETLLTHVHSFIDNLEDLFLIQSLSTRLTTSPPLFHSAFLAITQFISSWPTQRSSSCHLRAIRSCFQLPVYFLQVASAPWKKLQEAADPAEFSLVEGGEEGDEARLLSAFPNQALDTLRSLWSEETFLLPLAGKCWEQTTKILSLCINYVKAVADHYSSSPPPSSSLSPWTVLLATRVDSARLGQLVFDEALLSVWPRLRELGLDTSKFGQTMTAFSQALEREADSIKDKLVETLSRELDTQTDGISQLPKQYRWTKKPSPTTVSTYITTIVSRLDEAIGEAEGRGVEGAREMGREAMERTAGTLVGKAEQVLETVNATGLSRLKRREGTAADGESDEDKIRLQMNLDLTEIAKRLEGGETEEKIRGILSKLTLNNRQPHA